MASKRGETKARSSAAVQATRVDERSLTPAKAAARGVVMATQSEGEAQK